jgi:hypothetical protein
MGSSQTVGALCGSVAKNGFMATTGSARSTNPMNIVDAQYIVLWGTNTRITNRHLWPFIEEAHSKGAKVVVIDPIRTITADEADWFIQPFPGTDTALMLAMMHVIIRDELCDEKFVAQHTEGFEELAAEVASWTPERAAAECGVDATDIETFAHEYATTQPAFIRTIIGAEHRENGAMLFRTMACLPTLTGAWKHRGGGLSRSVGSWFNDFVDDSVFDSEHLSGVLAVRAIGPPGGHGVQFSSNGHYRYRGNLDGGHRGHGGKQLTGRTLNEHLAFLFHHVVPFGSQFVERVRVLYVHTWNPMADVLVG